MQIFFSRGRTVLLLLFLILVGGIFSFLAIPKEADPDVPIPFIYVYVTHQGISPEDAERLLVRPLETELQSLEGLKEMTAVANEGHASITLEFDAGFDNQKALLDVREKVDAAKSELPDQSDEPQVRELNVGLFPMISVILSGDLPIQQHQQIARSLQDRLEALPEVLEADIRGEREDLLEVIIPPHVLETYNLNLPQVINFVRNNNQLVAAGAIETTQGKMVIKVPGVVKTYEDALNLPLTVHNGRVVRFGDVAEVRQTYKTPSSLIRLNGNPALALDVKKRLGANIIETSAKVRATIGAAQKALGQAVHVTYLQDKSTNVKDMLWDLQNNILSAILLVMVVVILFLGRKPSLLVGLAIPGSFLASFCILYMLGYSVNIVVLFSLILVVGMLVDGAIIVIELAQHHLEEGLPPKVAYRKAAERMTWPIIGSTLTTLVVFLPLLFWPGITGQFMKYLPITVIITLTASLFMALIFIPVLGSIIQGKKIPSKKAPSQSPSQTPFQMWFAGLTEKYIKTLQQTIARPMRTVLLMIGVLFGAVLSYGILGKGVEFFPDVDADNVQVTVRAQGDLSIYEKDAILTQVEHAIIGLEGINHVYGRTGVGGGGGGPGSEEDIIGSVLLQLNTWQDRPKTEVILANIRQKLAPIAGIEVEVFKERSGPRGGKPFEVEISSLSLERSEKVLNKVLTALQNQSAFIDIEDTRPLPGIEWAFEVNREEAARYGVDILLLGQMVQLVTHGLFADEYRPDFSTESVDIRLRLPKEDRHLQSLKALRIPSNEGPIPLINFVTIKPQQKTGTLYHTDGRQVLRIKADLKKGTYLTEELKKLNAELGPFLTQQLKEDPSFFFHIKGEQADQKEAATFLRNAFIIAVFLMLLILVTQFNSFYQSFLVLSAIVFSTAGVFLALLLTGEPFGIVMCGIALISLAGVVVNNNIVLIDTYNEKRKTLQPKEALLTTCALRFRPVILTAVTTVLGLIPMVLSLNIDLIGRSISHGAPSTQWWTQLATSIAGGLTFATVLTLFMTPALLLLGEKYLQKYKASH